MLEPRRGRSLAPKALDELLVLGEARMQELQRHTPVEQRVLGAPHVRHPPGPEAPQQPVAPGDDGVLRELHQPPLANRLSITWIATGPATSAPKQPWQRSMVAATATWGSVAGANAMNHGWLIPALTSISAVPVLPAKGTPPLTVRPVAVPSEVTFSIMEVSWAAVSGLIAVDCTWGVSFCVTRPSGSVTC